MLVIKQIYTTILLILSLCVISQAQITSITPSGTNVPAPTQVVSPIPAAYSNTIKVNAVRTWTAMAPYTTASDVITSSRTAKEVAQTTAYFDGLGRPLQSVTKQASPLGKDFVSMHVYDAFGRESLTYLPYAQNTSITNDGKLKLDPFATQSAFMQTQFPGEQVFYGQTIFEASPLSRPLKTLAPGNSWAGSNRGVSMSYETNVTDEVISWTISMLPSGILTSLLPSYGGRYEAGQLRKLVITDEHGKKTIEYKDKEGLLILKKVQIADNAITSSLIGWLSTYYVYDDYGLLRFVITPKVSKQFPDQGIVEINQEQANELCFQYAYDARNRMIGKKVPGAAWVYMVYDKRDRLVFIQDGNMRGKSPNWWMYTLYDFLNRPIQTGMMINNITRDDLQNYVDATTGGNTQTDLTQGANFIGTSQTDLLYSNRDAQITQYQATNSITFQDGFESTPNDAFVAEIVSGTTNNTNTTITVTNNPIPPDATTIPLTYSFYDNYQQTNKTYTTAYNSLLAVEGTVGTDVFPESLPTVASSGTKGMPTVTRVRVIEDANNLTLGNWLETATFYDEKGRPIQVIADNYKGGKDITTNLYDFSGKVLTSYSVHNNAPAGINNQRIRTQMVYDHAGRVIKVYKQINDDPNSTRQIIQNNYNELGQLLSKDIGQRKDDNGNLTSTPLDSDNYTYNIRGWLKGVNWNYGTNATNPLTNIANNKWFAYDLSYDWGFSQNQYNGNIAGQRWMSAGDLTERAFGYNYDNANRLLFADFNQNNGSGTSAIWNKSLTASGTGSIDFTIKMGDGIDYTKAYDENGNILQMQQMGMNTFNSSAPIDNLKYYYYSNSNKLQNVIDLNNLSTTKLGDFRTATTHIQYTAKQSITNESIYNANMAAISAIADYGYDVNGNLITDRNKDIKPNNSNGVTGIDQATGGAIEYNHLNLPYKITVAGKGTITYIYDAVGNKLEKRTTDVSNTQIGEKKTTTTYLGGFVYENNSLQFFAHEEGRIRQTYNQTQNSNNYSYDYMLKDHLGNVRAMLTDEQKQDFYPAATLENGAIATEQNYYDIVQGNIVDNPTSLPNTYPNNNGNPPYNPNPNSSTTAASQKMYQLNGATNNNGLGITLKVMAGDVVNIFGKSYWFDNGTQANNNYPLTNTLIGLLTSFANSNSIANSGKGVTGQVLNNTNTTTNGLNTILSNNPNPTNPNQPKAYINWILFDEHFVPVNAGVSPVDAGNVIKSHAFTANISKSGYLYVYCSNESNKNVFFDNLQLVHNRGALLEETHYYPFGLTMSGVSSKAVGSVENKRKYNGIEYENSFDLNIGEAFFRSHDPQLGRWWQIDPKPDYSESPYSAMSNNPLLRNDPLGDKDSVANKPKPKTILVPIREKDFPNIYKNLLKSLAKGKPMIITYDANRQNARQRRREALKNTPPKQGYDRDEYPYASTKEGGKGADVNYVPRNENRKHGGLIGALVVGNNMQTGDRFEMLLIPNTPDQEPQTSPSPVTNPAPITASRPKPVGTTVSDGVSVGVVIWVIWKVIEGVATAPVCGGCGALSPL